MFQQNFTTIYHLETHQWSYILLFFHRFIFKIIKKRYMKHQRKKNYIKRNIEKLYKKYRLSNKNNSFFYTLESQSWLRQFAYKLSFMFYLNIRKKTKHKKIHSYIISWSVFEKNYLKKKNKTFLSYWFFFIIYWLSILD